MSTVIWVSIAQALYLDSVVEISCCKYDELNVVMDRAKKIKSICHALAFVS